MPQLNPSPWLPLILFSWFILLTIAPIKVLAHTLPAEPTPQDAKTLGEDPWNWSCQQDSLNNS
uniref:ATP synthase F0 subunit 8 n=1 Tax=Parupeneus cyclostomus TaxID=586844 RepID=UPI00279F5BEB|nr:ATP synthase F0 subunit 8 [Parupeneus cyclostomus]WGO62603.1 ATP synthase F0 subunit 8 [Parupeneus cyclostomus]WNH20169.1 ATP synthase F0 subunit 8 [Parupeneus cyclostomus]WSP03254.1 ATP synthase F0 subunit 8 [Parupeneus cyclostomus]